MSKRLTKEKLNKLISENEDSMTYSVPADDQTAFDKAKEASKTDGVDSTVQLTTENDIANDPIKDAFIAGLIAGNSSNEGTFVVVDGKLTNSDIAEREFALYKGVNESDDDLPEIPDEEKMERGDEYGVNVYENIDKTMEKLKKSNAPTVKINESIKPRIKKSDLINYIKNKK